MVSWSLSVLVFFGFGLVVRVLVSWCLRPFVSGSDGVSSSFGFLVFGILVFSSHASLVSLSLRVYFISRLQLSSCPSAFGVFIDCSCLQLVSWSFRVLVFWCFGLLQSCSLGVLVCLFLGPYVLCTLVLVVFW